LDCIWLVNEEGKYEQTIDHDFLAEYFEIDELSRERGLYGKNRVPLGAIKQRGYRIACCGQSERQEPDSRAPWRQ
jgi:hypothetical protein